MVLVLIALTSSCDKKKISYEAFRTMRPFKGNVVEYKELGYPEVAHSYTGPDMQITIRKRDGTIFIIKRMHTVGFPPLELDQLMKKASCDFPKDIAAFESEIYTK